MSRAVSATGVMLVICVMAWAADDPAVKRYKERQAEFEKAKALKVAAAEAAYSQKKSELEAYQTGVVRKVRTPTAPTDKVKQWRFPDLKSKERYVATAQREADLAEKALSLAKLERMTLPSLAAVPKIGDIFSTPGVNVIQVIDEQAMLVRDYVTEGGRVAVAGGQVIREAVVTHEVWMVLRGFPTAGVVDDSGYEPKGVLEVTGTESYTTVSGAKKTVFTVRPFDEKRLDAVRKKAE